MKIRSGCRVFVAMAIWMAGVVVAGAQSAGDALQGSTAVGLNSASGSTRVSGRDATAGEANNGARPGDSHIRIVRLSEVKGALQLDRKTGNGFEQTMPNMPIIEGERLRTADGYAEVEFEDNSTLRVAPQSLVEFPLLALRSSGTKASTVNVVRGMVYVNLQSTKGNEFQLVAGGQRITVMPATHVRMMVGSEKTVVSVFGGSVEVQRGSETMLVAKKQTLTLGATQVNLAKKIEEDPYDVWDKESNDYHARYSQANAFAGSGSSFGLSDLNYYGGFINVGAYGSFWQPYFVGAGWNPYANGVWALYPGAGYSWVSPYPWGWLPYHTGTWSFYPGYGWGWQPGGNWNGLNNVVSSGGQTAGTPAQSPIRSPLRPTAPPTGIRGAATPSLVLSGDSPIVFSKEDKQGNFVFQMNSAGLGVPRGSLGGLSKISSHVEQHGSASMQVYATAPSGVGTPSRAGGGPVTLRAGTPIQSGNSSIASAPQSEAYARSSTSGTSALSHNSGTAAGSSSGGNQGGSSHK